MALVYLLTNTVNGKRYVGKTNASLAKRWYKHAYIASVGGGFALHAAIRKYGPKVFKREVLQECDSEEDALRAEQEWVAKLGTLGDGGYNLCEGGRGAIGHVHSPESRAAMSDIAKSKGQRPNALAIQRSAEVRAAGMSDEAKAALTEGQRRRRAEQPVTDEFRATMREVALKRAPRGPASAETKAKMAMAQTARWAERKASGITKSTAYVTDEYRAKQSAAMKAARAKTA